MLIAFTQSDKECFADTTLKTEGPFTCPACKGPVTLKKGQVVTHHFAHTPPVNCEFYENESAAHLNAKRAIFSELQTCPEISKLKLERFLGTIKPDISFYLHGHPCAIEVQHSSISPEKLFHRTSEYAKKGIAVLWSTIRAQTPDRRGLYKTNSWERWIHALNFGKLPVYTGGASFAMVHYESAEIIGDDWFDSDGEEHEGSIYYPKTLKHYKGLDDPWHTVALTARKRGYSSFKHFKLPACKILVAEK